MSTFYDNNNHVVSVLWCCTKYHLPTFAKICLVSNILWIILGNYQSSYNCYCKSVVN